VIDNRGRLCRTGCTDAETLATVYTVGYRSNVTGVVLSV